MLETSNANQTSDHDLLIRIETKMENLISDIKEWKCSTTTQISDHEVRIKKLENKVGNFVIYITLYSAAVATLIGIMVYHILSSTPNVTP
jgi:chromatin segregation and condensation protein Rec8/ScpA/Scc1 (kleisin family)